MNEYGKNCKVDISVFVFTRGPSLVREWNGFRRQAPTLCLLAACFPPNNPIQNSLTNLTPAVFSLDNCWSGYLSSTSLHLSPRSTCPMQREGCLARSRLLPPVGIVRPEWRADRPPKASYSSSSSSAAAAAATGGGELWESSSSSIGSAPTVEVAVCLPKPTVGPRPAPWEEGRDCSAASVKCSSMPVQSWLER